MLKNCFVNLVVAIVGATITIVKVIAVADAVRVNSWITTVVGGKAARFIAIVVSAAIKQLASN